MKKILNKLVLVLATTTPIVTALSCGKFGNSTNFVGIGSNSVSPLIMGEDSIMTKNPIGQYTYQNTGSGDGYKSQMGDPNIFKSDFGMTSSQKNPISYSKGDQAKLDELKQLWAKKRLRTITYAFDAIGIGVHLPDGMKLKDGSKVPIVNLFNLAKLYSQDAKLVNSVTWASLINNEVEDPKWATSKPIAIGIKGGEKTSGKSEAFVKVVDKKLQKELKLPKSDVKAGKAPINPTQKSVVSVVQKFSFVDSFNDIFNFNKLTKGSVAYYSLGQISTAKSNEVVLAAVDELMNDDSKTPTIEMVQAKQYRWSRPFNIIYSITNSKSVALANYLLSQEAQDFIKSKNFVGLSADQIKVQLPTWRSDLDYIDKAKKVKAGINGETIGTITTKYGL